jgi:hypothetical protein
VQGPAVVGPAAQVLPVHLRGVKGPLLLPEGDARLGMDQLVDSQSCDTVPRSPLAGQLRLDRKEDGPTPARSGSQLLLRPRRPPAG